MNKYFIHDARTIDTLPINTKVDLIITSPPYFDMKDYGSKNQIGFGQNYENYLDDLELVFRKCRDITKDTGSLWIIVDILRKDGELKLLPFDTIQRVQKSGWLLRDIIIWEKDRTVPFTHSGQMRNISEYILYFSKTNDFKFYRERITAINDLKEWWQKYPERYSPDGKSPSNIWRFPIPLQGSWGKKYIKHFCPLPEELIERIINLSSDVGDLILDPFAGSGAVLSAAYRMKRKYIGSDLNNSYKEMFLNYVKEIKQMNFSKKYGNRNLKTFSKTIGKLRLLKLAKKLQQEYAKKHTSAQNNILSILVLSKLPEDDLPKNKFLVGEYILVVIDKIDVDRDILIKMINNPPLSKYGISPEIRVMDLKEVTKYIKKKKITNLWKYENGITHEVGKKIKFVNQSSLFSESFKRYPIIISDIALKESELLLEAQD